MRSVSLTGRLLCAVLLLTIVLIASLAASAHAVPASNPADRLLGVPLDEPSYDRARRCYTQPRRGMLAFQAWMSRNVAGSSWGIMRCETWGPQSASLHAEGRALDWHLDAAHPASRREAYKLIRLLMAADRNDQPFALARRMGVQEIIYNCQAWFGWGQLRRYSACYNKHGQRKKRVNRTLAHIDHLHIGLNRAGAALRTSFWTRKPAEPTEPVTPTEPVLPDPSGGAGDPHAETHTGGASAPAGA